jgi:hypothetical protein
LRRAARRTLPLLAALAVASACASLPREPPLVPLAADDATAAAWLARLRERESSLRSMRAVGKLRVEAENGKGRVREVIVAERPARLRLETLNLLGQTQALLVVDGEGFEFFDGRRVERGRSSERALEHLGLELAPDAAVTALLAAPALPEGEPLQVLGGGGVRVVVFPTWRLRFSPVGELRALDALDPAGALEWSARYERWQEVPGGRYPFEIVLHFAGSRLRAELELERVELDLWLDPSLFRVPGS